MKLGFVGFGEAAYQMAMGLFEEGLKDIVAYDQLWDDPIIGSLIKERAQKASVELVHSLEEVSKNVSVLIVAVPANKAFAVSQSIFPFLNKDVLYVDVSASSPDVKLKIDKLLKEKEIAFVDAAMMGPLTVYKHKVPILASGEGADRFNILMIAYNMEISIVSNVAGDASTTKLVRSIFMKGISTLLIEMLSAASHFQVEKQVVDSIIETMNKSDFETTMNRLITGTAIHSERRSSELDGVIHMLQAEGLSSAMTVATKETLDKVTASGLQNKYQGVKPNSWEDVINVLNKELLGELSK